MPGNWKSAPDSNCSRTESRVTVHEMFPKVHLLRATAAPEQDVLNQKILPHLQEEQPPGAAARRGEDLQKIVETTDSKFSFFFSVISNYVLYLCYSCFPTEHMSVEGPAVPQGGVSSKFSYVFVVADGPKNVKFVSRIDGNVEPKRAVRKPSPSNKDVRLGPLPF